MTKHTEVFDGVDSNGHAIDEDGNLVYDYKCAKCVEKKIRKREDSHV